MIKEAKNLVRDLAAAITPSSLASNDAAPMNVNGSYDCNAQAYSYDVCNAKTYSQTRSGQGPFPYVDDQNMDNNGF